MITYLQFIEELKTIRTSVRNEYDNLHKHSSALEGYKITSDINTLIKKYEIMINKHEQQENA